MEDSINEEKKNFSNFVEYLFVMSDIDYIEQLINGVDKSLFDEEKRIIL